MEYMTFEKELPSVTRRLCGWTGVWRVSATSSSLSATCKEKPKFTEQIRFRQTLFLVWTLLPRRESESLQQSNQFTAGISGFGIHVPGDNTYRNSAVVVDMAMPATYHQSILYVLGTTVCAGLSVWTPTAEALYPHTHVIGCHISQLLRYGLNGDKIETDVNYGTRLQLGCRIRFYLWLFIYRSLAKCADLPSPPLIFGVWNGVNNINDYNRFLFGQERWWKHEFGTTLQAPPRQARIPFGKGRISLLGTLPDHFKHFQPKSVLPSVFVVVISAGLIIRVSLEPCLFVYRPVKRPFDEMPLNFNLFSPTKDRFCRISWPFEPQP